MKLNPGKCKEMVISFIKNTNFLLCPIVVGSTMIQRVTSYKLLGVFIDDDLKWSTHIDYIYKKACKRLYSLKLLRRPGVSVTGMLKIHLSGIVPNLEYAVPVWTSIYEMQSEKLKSIQRAHVNVKYIGENISFLLRSVILYMQPVCFFVCWETFRFRNFASQFFFTTMFRA